MGDCATPLLIYDGECPFCAASALWVIARSGERARAVPWQALALDELATYALTPADVCGAAWWIEEGGPRSGGHLAIAKALAAGSGWAAVAGRLLRVSPFRWIAGVAYALIARRRKRLPSLVASGRAGR